MHTDDVKLIRETLLKKYQLICGNINKYLVNEDIFWSFVNCIINIFTVNEIRIFEQVINVLFVWKKILLLNC